MVVISKHIKIIFLSTLLVSNVSNALAITYTVNSKANLQTKMNAALPGDTVIVSNGIYYNWGTINITNTKGSSTSNWIVLKAESFGGAIFSGTVNLQFSGKRIFITGFKFSNGSSGSTDVIQFRNTANVAASYCRLTNIIIENFSSDSTGSVDGTSPDIDNKWISVYGTNNRVDHCTFVNKYNAGATVTIWYDNNTYPNASTPTYHTIDSNYFKGRGYMGNNGGESMRLGTSTTSRTNAYNIVEYNLFESCSQVEPEIISSKSNFNTYRYNTFKNCNGGLTLRHGRYCNVYSNFFIVTDNSYTRSYGVRVIDKGHRVFNNYFEGLLGNKNTLSSLRCPIILYNGLTTTTDTTTASKANGYFPADSTIVAFNTIVNCSGGAGIVIGFTDGGSNTFQPKGIKIANNLIKMTTGQAAYNDALNTALTYTAEGNFYNASSIGLPSASGFSSMSMNFATRVYGVFISPNIVQDAAINTTNYVSLLNAKDVIGASRSSVYDVGALELNGSGGLIATPLDSNVVGAGKPSSILPVIITNFTATQVNNQTQLKWTVELETNFKQYDVELALDGKEFSNVAIVKASQQTAYTYNFVSNATKLFVRLKLIDVDGKYNYSKVIQINKEQLAFNINIYPNPPKDVVNISYGGDEKNITLNIVDAKGNTVKQLSLNTNKCSISTKDFANGLHSFQFIKEHQIVSTQKIIIAKN